MEDSKLKQLEEDAKRRETYSSRVYIVGGGYQYVRMFYDAGFSGARWVEEADIICFTGGADVHPSFYGEEVLPSTHFNLDRDNKEAAIFGEALGLKIPMVGICRGAQFLNVMNGGGLWQHVNNHTATHDVTDVKSGTTRKNMTSTHHQMMIPGPGAEVLALAAKATLKKSDKTTHYRNQPEEDDAEAIWYSDTQCLCFQPHPEFMHGDCRDYFLELFDNYILPTL